MRVKNSAKTLWCHSAAIVAKECLPFLLVAFLESSRLAGFLFEGASVDFKAGLADRTRVVEDREFFAVIALDLMLTSTLEVEEVFLVFFVFSLVASDLFFAIFLIQFIPQNKQSTGQPFWRVSFGEPLVMSLSARDLRDLLRDYLHCKLRTILWFL